MADPSPQPTKRQLSGKQRAFIDAYIGPARFNATEAARIAGYSDPQQSGWENKQNPDIRARIDAFLDAETVTATEILHELTDVGMRGLHEFVTITRYDADGNPISAKMDASAKLKALELLGKNRGMFTDKVDVTGDLGVTYELVGIDPAEMP